MRVFAIRIEDALGVAVQRSHDADAREHRRAAERRDQDQRFHCRLPFCRRVFGLRKLGNVGASVLEGDELTALEKYRLIEFPRPTALSDAWHRHRLQRRLAAVGS
jgi:hypothetical protein